MFTPWPLPIPRRAAAACLAWAMTGWAVAPSAVWAQDPVAGENTHIDYAQVLRVQPVYETLRATRMESRCTPVDGGASSSGEEKPSALSRITGSVRRLFGSDDPEPAATPLNEQCVSVPVQRTFRRPYAYDVDYVYKGSKYRSRLPRDPGNKLPIRVSVTPVMNETTP